MISDITIGQYFPGNSAIHKMDARMKIVLTLGLIISFFVCRNFFSLGLGLILVAIIVAISKVPAKMIMKSIKPLLIILIFTAALNVFYNKDGNVLVDFWIITITDKGIYIALFTAIRIIMLVVVSSLLTYTTTPTLLTDAIERLLSPLKVFHVQVHTLAMIMTLALRFIPVLIEEIERIMNAQKARGADLESGGLMKRAKALIPILIPLFVSAFRRAYELAFAMECRCYTGGEGRTRMKQMKMHGRDYVSFVVFVLFIVGIILLNIYFPKLI